MATKMVRLAIFCVFAPVELAQNGTVEQFMHDKALQDSIIAAIVPSHALMSKVINKVAENRQLHEMVIQHLTRLLTQTAGSNGEHDHTAHEAKSQYAGDDRRQIKALSESDVTALLNGEGMGMAMAAELNHYPGPRHVLDLSDRLQLTREQKESAQGSYDRMHANAITIGKQIVDNERHLDEAFASGGIDVRTLTRMMETLEDLRGRLRGSHLAAHIEMKNLLTPCQVASYDSIRGYSSLK